MCAELHTLNNDKCPFCNGFIETLNDHKYVKNETHQEGKDRQDALITEAENMLKTDSEEEGKEGEVWFISSDGE